jgi:hypothetical protein
MPMSSFLMPAGRLVGFESITLYGGTTTVALTANQQYWWPLIAPKTMTVLQLWVRVATPAGAGGVANLGLYEGLATGSLIGALLGSILAVPMDTGTGTKVFTFSTGVPVVAGGIYWMSIQPSAAVSLTAHSAREDTLGRSPGQGIATGAYNQGVARAWSYASGLRVTNPVDWNTKVAAYCGGIVTV